MRRKAMMLGKSVPWVRGVLAVWLGVVCAYAGGSSAEITSNPRDTLVYKDGDRIMGKVIGRTEQTIVFKSERFGELRVPAGEVVIIPGDTTAAATPPAAPAKPPAPPPAAPATPAAPPKSAVAAAPKPPPAAAPTAKSAADAATRREEEKLSVWDRFSPAVLTAQVRKFFGPWKGRFAFSTEIVSDVADTENSSWEGRVQRKWTKDEVQFNVRYDYADTNNVRTTDTIKGSGSVRHDFNKQIFSLYRPTIEWNRASRRQGVPNNYVMLQQEFGLGYNLYTSPTRKVRLGGSLNRFDVWNDAPVADHTHRGVPSVFEEVEIKLPWQMGLTQRGVWYPVHDQRDGWENRVELNKKLSETLSTSLRHEIRRNNPDGSVQDYERLKLLLAIDF